MYNYQKKFKNSEKEEKQKNSEIKIIQWIKTWEKVQPIMNKIKRNELLSSDYASHYETLDQMLQLAYEHRKIRLMSGLVEQQRLFMKMREKLRKDGVL